MFIVEFFIISKKRKILTCPSTGIMINQTKVILSNNKGNKILVHTATSINLKTMFLREKKKSDKANLQSQKVD